MKSINFIDEEECPKHSDSLDIPDFKDIYHGCMSREVSVKTLRASGKDKCYLVRKRINPEDDVDSVEYILSFVNGDEDYHFKIKKDQKYFIFANRYFPSFKCVISHYMVSNIINDAHLEFAVVNKTISAVREKLRGERCYLAENISDERMKELLCNDCAGSYLFRSRTDDNNQFVVMFFDGSRIHKVKMDVRLVERKIDLGNGDEQTEPVAVLVLGRNFFESWKEMVENFRVNPIVAVKGENCEDKLMKEVDVNHNVNLIEQEDIYRKLKFNHALQPPDVYSIHGEVLYTDGSKLKWKSAYALVDKDHGHLILRSAKTNSLILELSRSKFIPIHYSVHQRYCFLLMHRDQNGTIKNYYFSMSDVLSPADRRPNNAEETYAYRQYNLSEHDKEVYHSTEAEKDTDTLLCRAYDRWTMAVKRHCYNTKDDIANEENRERHLKLHRYNRRLKLQIGHSGGQEMSLTDADLVTTQSLNPYILTNQFGQFEVLVGNNVIYTVPRVRDGNAQTILFQDLPSNIGNVSINIRIKGSKRKEFTKELCNYTITHQELVPRPLPSIPLPSFQQTSDQVTMSPNLPTSVIMADPPSTCGPISVDCYASIDYKELIILPFKFYGQLSKYFMDNLRPIFDNPYFSESFNSAIEQPEFKKLLNCFLYMAIWEKKQVEFLYIFFENDLKHCESSCYFRQNTVASKLFLDYMSQFASDWLVSSFVHFFEELYINSFPVSNCEPSNDIAAPVDGPDKLNNSDETMFKCLDAALSGMSANLKHCPLTLRQLFNMIQAEIKRQNPLCADSEDGLHFRLLTNLVMLRFFCAVLNSRGERQNDFFRKISENIRQKNDPRFKDFPKLFGMQEPLNEFLVKISRHILTTFSVTKSKDSRPEENCRGPHDDSSVGTSGGPTDDISRLIREHRDSHLQSFNDDLTGPLAKLEMECIDAQLEKEYTAICRLSLSRRFNDALEFLTRIQEEPTYFLKKKEASPIARFDVITPQLSAIVDDINQKKSCSNTA